MGPKLESAGNLALCVAGLAIVALIALPAILVTIACLVGLFL